jgi:hypothetical protein
VTVPVKVRRHWPDFMGPVQLTRVSGPAQTNGQLINIPNTTINAPKDEAEVKFTVPANTAPGAYNLVLQEMGTLSFSRESTPNARKQNIQVRTVTPPVRLTVFNAAAELAVAPPTVAVPVGGSAALALKLKRLYGYKGEFKVQLVLPGGFQGVTAAAVTVAPSASEARLVLQAAANAKPAVNANVLVRVTALVDRITLTQEAKLTVAITQGPVGATAPADAEKRSLLAPGSPGWKYLPASRFQDNRWQRPDLDDAKWRSGQAPLGYGEDEVSARQGTTIAIQGQPVVFRRVFDVPTDVLAMKDASFRLAVASDDSATVYLNGELVDDERDADHEYRYWNREVDLRAGKLRAGRNVVAVLVKNGNGSSDLYLDLEITALVPKKK